MNLENIMLSQKSRIQKITYFMILFVGNIQKRKYLQTECKLLVSRDYG